MHYTINHVGNEEQESVLASIRPVDETEILTRFLGKGVGSVRRRTKLPKQRRSPMMQCVILGLAVSMGVLLSLLFQLFVLLMR